MTKTFLQQADHLVRNHPANKELLETHLTGAREGKVGSMMQFKHDAHLEHYLRVLPKNCAIGISTFQKTEYAATVTWPSHAGDEWGAPYFNLTTGAPATEKDAEAFIKLVS